MAEKTVTSFDGTKIFYRIVRKKKKKNTLVFLHGVGGNWTVWKKELEFFERLGYTTIAVDLRGHGLSDINLSQAQFRFGRHLKDIRKILDTERIREYIFVGHSLGGGIGISYCGAYKTRRPKGMVLIETAIRNPFEKDHELGLNPYLVRILKFIVNHEPTRKKHMPHLKELDYEQINEKDRWYILTKLLYATPLRSIIKTLEALERYNDVHQVPVEHALRRLRVPVLVIGGLKDTIVPAEFSEEIHWLIHNSKLKLFKKAHHRVPVEEASELNKVMHEFLDSHKLH